MSKSGNGKNVSKVARESDQPPGVLLFEIDRRKLRTMRWCSGGPP